MPLRPGYVQLGHLLPEDLAKRFFATAGRNGHAQTEALNIAMQLYLAYDWPERPEGVPRATKPKRGRPKKGK